jgi:MFS transporter, ACS family, tartrate transporter
MTSPSLLPEVARRTTRRVALRLLPLVFVIYVINYIDRVNVSFANLRMSVDLGLSDRVYGLGVAMFYVTYVLFEIPGAIIVERWSARKWIARIMISWGLVTLFTGFIHSATQFYAARFLLGAAESSFFPGMIVYLTHWFRQQERSRAIACLYAAVPTSAMIGSPLAGALLSIHWLNLAGWRWLFIMEGIPAVILGVITLFYLTDRPAEARWLPPDERAWLSAELAAETQTKKRVRDYTILQAFYEPRILLLAAAWLLATTGFLSNTYWIPTFVKRISGFPVRTVTSLLLIPGLLGLAAIVINGWHSDKTSERRWHAALPLLLGGLMYAALASSHLGSYSAAALLLLGSAFYYPFLPAFWAMPTAILSESAAAASIGLINSIGQLGGFAGPYLIGFLNDRTHSLTASFAVIAAAYLTASAAILSLGPRQPSPPSS